MVASKVARPEALWGGHLGAVILDFPETLVPPSPHCRAPSGAAWGFPAPAPGRSSPAFSWTPPSPATPWSWEFLGFLGREFQGQGEGYVFGGGGACVKQGTQVYM